MPRPKAPTPEERQAMAEQSAAEKRAELEAKGTYVSPTRAGSVEPPLMDEDHDQKGRLEQTSEEEAVADAAVWSATMAGTLAQPKGLHVKLAEIMAIAARIPKNGTAPAAMGGYKFVQVGDAADPIRKALSERSVTMMPHDIEEWDTVIGGKSGYMTTQTIKVTWRLTDGETGEFYDLPSLGTGADSGDKFSPKAQTNAMKYAILMGFLLSTGDDPEAADLTEPAQGQPINITGSNITGVRQGGRQSGATQPQLDAIRARARELELSPESLAVLIASTLGGKAPDIDNLETNSDRQRAVLDFLGALSFDECASVVQALEHTEDALDDLGPEDTGAK